MDTAFLLDHRVRGSSILPGSWFLAGALERGACLRDIDFLAMQRLEAAPDERAFELLREADDSVRFVATGDGRLLARARLDARSPDRPNGIAAADAPTDGEALDRTAIYARLSAHANEYAPAFQGLDSIRLGANNAVARFVAPACLASDRARLTVMLDACTHAVAVLANLQSTYLLSSIASVARYADPSTDSDDGGLRIRVELRQLTAARVEADLRIDAADGAPLLVVQGLVLATFESGQVQPAETIALAATFTIDPFERFGDFWSRSLDLPLSLRLADYDQLNQAMVSASGGFADADARHVALVRVADFDRRERNATLPTRPGDRGETPVWPAGLPIHRLPDGREVAGLNEYETQYLYQEIFRDLAYRRYDVRVLDGDTVIDIGANIGFFSLFAASEAADIRSIAIEPSPAVIPMLRANLARYSPASTVIEAGASSEEGVARFSAYRNSSVFSSFDADGSADAEAISQVIRNTLEGIADLDEVATDRAVEELMAGRLDVEEYDCRLVAVSDVIDAEALTRIGLLKIDAEKSEDAILAGIREEHWARIEQVVIEVHLQGGRSDAHIVDMLEGHGFVVTRDEEALLSDSGLITLYAVRPERLERNRAAAGPDTLDRVADGLVDAARAHAARTSVPLDVVFCRSDVRDPAVLARHAEVERTLGQRLAEISGTSVRSWDELTAAYPVAAPFDANADASAHIPFTDEWYAATATALVREHLLRTRPPLKVIVVDGDNTLWDGVVGEVGVEGIGVDARHRALHAWLQGRRAAGTLLCLASKNIESDVRAAIEQRDDIDLRWSDFTATRVNWQAKPLNLRSMADELSLGLDAFAFLDDSSVECAEMRAMLPQVITLEMRPDARDLPAMLDAVWPLEPRDVTEADLKRAERYAQERQRQDARSEGMSLASFIAGLDIDVTIEPMSDGTLARAAQMTLRTNQFNLTTVRRDADALSALAAAGTTIEVVSVKDRFGDYGITGLIVHAPVADRLRVDTFLLSCRVLGRAVEHAVLRHLGQVAARAGLASIGLPFAATDRNEPARRFLESLAVSTERADLGTVYVVDVDAAVGCQFTDDVAADTSASDAAAPEGAGVAKAWPSSESLQAIATDLSSAPSIASAASVRNRIERPELQTSYRAAATPLETQIAALWEETLAVDGIGMDDNFFELGGTSLRAVQMIATLQARHGHAVSVIELFEKPTIGHLAARIEGPAAGNGAELAPTRRRGAERRERQQVRRRVRR